jgi:DNA primase
MNFLDTLRSHGVEFRRSNVDRNEITICCPFCEFRSQSPDKRFRLGINIEKKVGHCFNCDWASRDALKEVSESLQLGFEDLNEETEALEHPPEKPELPEDFVLLSKHPKGTLYNKARDYLRDRHIPEWQIEEKKIGVSLCGKYSYRIIFPVYDAKHNLEGLVTRDFTGQQEPAYLNSANMKSLYNLPTLRSGASKAILCEGVFDCLAIERVVPDEYNVMAVLGRSLTDKQQEQLVKYRDIILWPDADLPGVKGFLDIAKLLAYTHRVFVVWPFGFGKDAAEMDVHDRKYAWSSRVRWSETVAMKLQNEVVFRE